MRSVRGARIVVVVVVVVVVLAVKTTRDLEERWVTTTNDMEGAGIDGTPSRAG